MFFFFFLGLCVWFFGFTPLLAFGLLASWLRPLDLLAFPLSWLRFIRLAGFFMVSRLLGFLGFSASELLGLDC